MPTSSMTASHAEGLLRFWMCSQLIRKECHAKYTHTHTSRKKTRTQQVCSRASPCRSDVSLWEFGLHQTQTCKFKETLGWLYSASIKAAQKTRTEQMACSVPGKTKMKQAASPPIREITRPISGMKRARTRVMINHTSVCRILLLLSRRTHTSTCSPWKRSQSPSITALKQHMTTAEYWEEKIHKN